MRSFLLLPALLGLSAALLAQSSAPADNTPTKDSAPETCTVTGRVITAADGNPLKSARIILSLEDTKSHDKMYAASSDSDGRFVLKDIQPGRYQFFASHSGFIDQQYKAGNNGDGPVFSLRSGEKVSDVLFRLVTAAVITGRVSNEDGDPMERVEVVALRRPGEEDMEDDDEPGRRKIQAQTVAVAETDDRGQYRIFGLKPGEYFVRADDNSQLRDYAVPVGESYWVKQTLGSDIGSVYFPSVTQLSQAQTVPLKAGEEAQAEITMRRVKTVEIAGRVIGASGPAARVMVRLEPADSSEPGNRLDRSDNTDEKGSFHFRNVPEGTYYVIAYQRDENSRVYDSRARLKVEVGGENIDGLTVSLNTGITIQGRVKVDGSSPIAFDRMHLSLMPIDEDGPMGAFTEVKKDGSFEFKSVHDGSYAIRIFGAEQTGAYIKSARRGPDDLFEKGVQVEGGSSGRIDVTLASDSAQLEGSVIDGDDAAIGAKVQLVPDPLTAFNRSRILRTSSDQLGHFILKDIPPGKYKVIAKPPNPSEGAARKSEPQAITLSEGEQKKTEIKIEKKESEESQ
jgi:hypothetical protein